MRRCFVRPFGTIAIVGLAAACNNDGTGPLVLPDPVVYEYVRFTVSDYSEAPEALVDQLAARLETEFDRVGALLPDFDAPPTPIPFSIFPGGGLAFITPAQNSITQWRDDLAPEYFTHQLTHLYTRYQQTEFIEEGLAVYVSEVLRAGGEAPNPYRHQPVHGWVALFQQHQSTIPLSTALEATNLGYDYGGSSYDASAWQLFVESGSFTRWMIDTYGRVPWYQFYLTGDPATVLGQDLADIQQEWLDHTAGAFPDPMTCEEALGTVGSREASWCARARGQ